MNNKAKEAAKEIATDVALETAIATLFRLIADSQTCGESVSDVALDFDDWWDLYVE